MVAFQLICKSIAYSFGRVSRGYQDGSTFGALEGISCDGSESDFTECQMSNIEGKEVTCKKLAVVCYNDESTCESDYYYHRKMLKPR